MDSQRRSQAVCLVCFEVAKLPAESAVAARTLSASGKCRKSERLPGAGRQHLPGGEVSVGLRNLRLLIHDRAIRRAAATWPRQ